MYESAIAFCLLLGASFALLGAIGLAKLPDFFTRLHAPTKATTLGIGGIALASLLYFNTRGDALSWHQLLLPLFLFLTAPVSAHMLAKCALAQAPVKADANKGEDN